MKTNKSPNTRRIIRQKAKKILMVSDLHVDTWDEQHRIIFQDFMDYAISDASEVIFLGDLLDLPSNNAFAATNAIRELLGWWAKLAENGVKITYLVGNHDVLMSLFPVHLPRFTMLSPSRKNPYFRTLGGRVVFLEHGHMHDPLYTSGIYGAMHAVEGMLAIDTNVVGAWALEKIRDRFPQLRHVEPPAHRPGLPDVINRIWEKAAQETLNLFPCEGVIMGHTHTPQVLWYGPEKFYLNTGTWVDLSTYVEVSEEELLLKDWRSGRVFGQVLSKKRNLRRVV